MRRWSLIAGLLFICSSSALAHDADILYVQVSRAPASGGRVQVSERVTLTATSLRVLVPVDADGDGELSQSDLDSRQQAIALGVWDGMPISHGAASCPRVNSSAQLRPGYIELHATFDCPDGELTQTFRLLSVLPSGYRVILGRQEDGATAARFAEGNAQTLVLPDRSEGASESPPLGLAGWIKLGVFHIFTGYDHLCFLAALLLVASGWRQVLAMVTAFTVAHSITLGSTALGLIPLSETAQRWVEVAIAASIVFVAAENLVRRTHRHRAAVTFGFGLVHGFGFASVLTSYGLGKAVATGLFGFNLGVELGQACVVVALFPLVGLLRRSPRPALWTVRGGSLAILVAGAFWMIQRALG